MLRNLYNRRKHIKAISYLWSGSLLGSGSTFLIYIILARGLKPQNFGLFSSALSTITILSLIGGFGVSQAWLKLYGSEGWYAIRWMRSSFLLILFSIILVIVLLLSWVILGPHERDTTEILIILSIFMVGQALIEITGVKFQLEERYQTLALWQFLPHLLRLFVIATIYMLVRSFLSVEIVSVIYSSIASIFIVVGIKELKGLFTDKFILKGHGLRPDNILNNSKNVLDVFEESWPFGLSRVFSFIYVQSDIIMLKYLVGDSQAGYYNAAFVILTAILLLPNVLYQKLLIPKLHRWANHDREKFYKSFRFGIFIMLIAGSAVCVFIFSSSTFVIELAFGENYTSSIELLKILSFSIPVLFVAFSASSTLVTQKYMRKKVLYMGIVALLNIFLNLVLIPKYHAKGAAIATLASNSILLLIYLYATTKYVFRDKI